MKPFVPYEKLSKKQRRVLDASRRGDWGAIKPITRRPENPKAYNRKNQRQPDDGAGFLCDAHRSHESEATRCYP